MAGAIILASLKVIERFFDFLCTTQGQAQVAEWRADREKFKADMRSIQAAAQQIDMVKIGDWFKKLDVFGPR